MEIQNAQMINNMEIQAAEAIAIFIIIIDKKSLYSCQLLRSQDFTCFYIYRCNLKTETDVERSFFLTIFLQLLSLKSLTVFFFLEWLLRNFSEKKKENTNEQLLFRVFLKISFDQYWQLSSFPFPWGAFLFISYR